MATLMKYLAWKILYEKPYLFIQNLLFPSFFFNKEWKWELRKNVFCYFWQCYPSSYFLWKEIRIFEVKNECIFICIHCIWEFLIFARRFWNKSFVIIHTELSDFFENFVRSKF